MSSRKPPSQRAKIDDVAKLAGVSTATVSRVINSSGIVSDRTAQKVHRAIADLRFVAHGSARGLAGSTTNMIGLVMPGIPTAFFSTLIQGISDYIYERDYSFLMYGDPRPTSLTTGKPLPLGDHNTDGLIVFTDFLDDFSIQYFHEQNLPIVMLLTSPPEGLDIPSVMFQNEDGGYQMTRHLIEEGNRRILYLRGPDGNEDSMQRQAGYRRALDEAGIEFDASLILPGGFSAAPTKKTLYKALDEGLEFDAVFAGDDNSALGTLEVFEERGIQVPEDIAVGGFNDDLMSKYITPSLTTIHAPVYESGVKAAEKLFALIEGGEVEPKSRLPIELVIRDSSVRDHQLDPNALYL